MLCMCPVQVPRSGQQIITGLDPMPSAASYHQAQQQAHAHAHAPSAYDGTAHGATHQGPAYSAQLQARLPHSTCLWHAMIPLCCNRSGGGKLHSLLGVHVRHCAHPLVLTCMCAGHAAGRAGDVVRRADACASPAVQPEQLQAQPSGQGPPGLPAAACADACQHSPGACSSGVLRLNRLQPQHMVHACALCSHQQPVKLLSPSCFRPPTSGTATSPAQSCPWRV